MQSDVARPHSIERAIRDAVAVAERFVAEEASLPRKRIALDLAGNIIAASEDFRKLVSGAPSGFPIEPTLRPGSRLPIPPLRRIVEESFDKAAIDPSWRGSAILGPPFADRSETYSITPVIGPIGLAGWILASRNDGSGSEPIGQATGPPDTGCAPGRIAALAEDSVLLLEPSEIRFAESDRHVVWLTTDCGRVRAATKGMDNVERELGDHGFLRVHRSFLINPDRVRRVHLKGNGLIALSTDYRRVESIPVSRRCTHEVRLRLGL